MAFFGLIAALDGGTVIGRELNGESSLTSLRDRQQDREMRKIVGLVATLMAGWIMQGCADQGSPPSSEATSSLPRHITAEIDPDYQIASRIELPANTRGAVVRLEKKSAGSFQYVKMTEYEIEIPKISIPPGIKKDYIVAYALYPAFVESALRDELNESLGAVNQEIRRKYGRKLDIFRWNLREVPNPKASKPMISACTDSRSRIDGENGRPIIRERGIHCAIAWIENGVIDRSRPQYIVGVDFALAAGNSLSDEEVARFESDAVEFLATVKLR